MRHINHSNVMKLEGVYETENSIYVILEYLEGVQLNEVLKVLFIIISEQQSVIERRKV
jgi:serine/threonine protein kinase